MADEKKTARFIFSAEPSLLARIDNWRSQQPGLPSRAEAVRRLIVGGLENDPTAKLITSIALGKRIK